MITVKTKIKTFTIPTSYQDITFEDFEFMHANQNDHFEIIKRLTGLNEVEMSLIELESLLPYFDFLKEDPSEVIEPFDQIELESITYTLPKRIGTKAWNQKIHATNGISNGNSIRVLSSYLQPIVDNSQLNIDRVDELELKLKKLSMFDLFGAVNYILIQLKAILEREKSMLSSIPKPEHIRAGIDKFNILADFNLIDMIASKYAYTHDQVEQLEYDLVFMILLKSNIQSKFDENLSIILKEQQ